MILDLSKTLVNLSGENLVNPYVEANDVVPLATKITLPAAAVRHRLQAVPYVIAEGGQGPVVVANGVVVSWIQGTAVAAEELVLDVWATPV